MESTDYLAKKVSPFAKRLVEEYIKGGMRSAEKAYLILRPNVSREGARNSGCRILRDPFVKAYLTELVKPDEKAQASAVEKYIARTEAVFKDAREEKKHLAALKCIEIGAKLEGAFGKEESDMQQYLKFRESVSSKRPQPQVQAQKVEVTVNVTGASPRVDMTAEIPSTKPEDLCVVNP